MNNPGDLGLPGGRRHLDEGLVVDVIGCALGRSDLELVAGHLRQCAACEELLRVRSAEYERLRAMPLPRRGAGGEYELERSRGALLQEDDSRAKPAPIRRRPVWGFPAAAGALAAAALALVVLLPLQGKRNNPEPVWLPPPSLQLILRSDRAPDADENLAAGLEAYRAGDAETAVQRLRVARTEDGLEDFRRLYLASALYNSGKAAEATEILQDLDLATLPEPWKGEGRWLWALALEATDRREEAQAVLRILAAADSPAGSRARARLGDVEGTGTD